MGAAVAGHHRSRRSGAVDIIFSRLSFLFLLGVLVLFATALDSLLYLFSNTHECAYYIFKKEGGKEPLHVGDYIVT